jgi:hypothetical protein
MSRPEQWLKVTLAIYLRVGRDRAWSTPSLNSMGPGIMRSGFAPLVAPGVVCTLRLADKVSMRGAHPTELAIRCHPRAFPPSTSADPILLLPFISSVLGTGVARNRKRNKK